MDVDNNRSQDGPFGRKVEIEFLSAMTIRDIGYIVDFFKLHLWERGCPSRAVVLGRCLETGRDACRGTRYDQEIGDQVSGIWLMEDRQRQIGSHKVVSPLHRDVSDL